MTWELKEPHNIQNYDIDLILLEYSHLSTRRSLKTESCLPLSLIDYIDLFMLGYLYY